MLKPRAVALKVNQPITSRRAILLRTSLWLVSSLTNQTFFRLQRSWHSRNRSAFVGSSLVVDVTTVVRAENVLAVPRLEDFATLSTRSRLKFNCSVSAFVAALRTTETLVASRLLKNLVATFTSHFLAWLFCSFSVSRGIVQLQLVAAFF